MNSFPIRGLTNKGVTDMKIKQTIVENNLTEAFLQGDFGIEKESLRVDKEGKLALTDHPSGFGSRSYHPYIQTDFSESQLELVTSAVDSISETYRWMAALHDVAWRTLPEDEWMWPFSMPGKLPSDDQIPIVKVEEEHQILYREELARKYGKRKQMISGIHINYGFSDRFLRALYEAAETTETFQDFSNAVHMKLARNFIRYRWLLTYMLGASPHAEPDFYSVKGEKVEPPEQYVRSLRNSPYGYHNTQDVQVSYASVEEYASDIQQMTQEGLLSEEREFYGSARVRGASQVKDLVANGIKYVEFRSIDVDPFDPFGLSVESLRFIHMFLLLLVWMEDEDSSLEKLTIGNEMNERTAMESPFSISQYQEEGERLLREMEEMASVIGADQESMESIRRAQTLMEHPEQTKAARLVDLMREESYLELGSRLASAYKQTALEKPFLLRGFENMEMSTQLLLFDALQKGIKVKILDEQDQFLRLSHQNHVEYVKNGNMTAKDTYIAPLIMENKTVTKKVLAEHGFVVPGGAEYISAADAKADYWKFEHKKIVVKPKSTNYGVGISVFKEPAARESFEEAVELAFQEDDAILVEEYAPGTEYRFFVLNGKTEAVLLRIPANVTGDGKQSVKELVEQKNQDPLRGENHRAPLEKIALGEIEQLMLRAQGLDVNSIPEPGQKVYLRENSNISTGGDSIDFTDQMHDSYKKIAAQITEVVGAKVSGVDLIIPDYTQPSTEENPGYTAIEANFNPAMHMHAYVYEGKGRRLTKGILNMLFPELYEARN